VSVVRLKFRCNILIIGKIIKEMPGSVASGTPYRIYTLTYNYYVRLPQYIMYLAVKIGVQEVRDSGFLWW